MNKKSLIIILCAITFFTGGTILTPIAHAQATGVVTGALTGAAAGAAAGSIVPVIGTGIGAGVGAVVGAIASASSVSISNVTTNLVAFLLAYLSNTALSIMAWGVTIAGNLLNTSMMLTLHIKDFVNSTEGVYTVWQTIRDISGIFIIFVLLYVSFLLILGQDSKTLGSPGNLIKNIVIAGILINFSFFITSLLIDASNVVSLAIYNGIISNPSVATTGGGSQTVNGQTINCPATTAGNLNTCVAVANTLSGSGGFGDIFMQYLKPQNIYDPKNAPLSSGTTAAPLQILMQGIVGCIIMFTIIMSFLLASLAFVARLVILILLLAFSPIWFATMIFPVLKDKAKQFTDHLYAQLVFMPVYLLLMYAALSILKNTTVFSAPSAAVFSGASSSFIPASLVVLAINDFFIIFLLNLPLVVAFSMGGSATGFLGGAVKRFNAANVWKNTGGFAATHIAGRAGYVADKYLANTRGGNTLLGRDLRAATTGALAKAKMGASRSHDERVKELKSVNQKAVEIERRKNLGRLRSASATPDQYKAVISQMSEKEKLNLGINALKNIEVLKHLKKSDFEAIKKSDEFTEEEKGQIKQLRKDAFADAIANNDSKVVGDMMKEMDPSDITDNPAHLTDDKVIANLKPAQLKKIGEDALLTDAEKRSLGNKIDVWSSNTAANPGGLTHPAYSFVNKNAAEWL